MENTEENKKIVSPFEFAIAEAIDPEYAKTMRPETQEEKEKKLESEIRDFVSRVKVNPQNL